MIRNTLLLLYKRKLYAIAAGIFLVLFLVVMFIKFVGFKRDAEVVERVDTYLLPENESLTVSNDGVVRHVANNSLLIKTKSIRLEDDLMRQIKELVGGSLISRIGDYYYQIDFSESVDLGSKMELLKRVPDITVSDYNDVLVSLYQPNDYNLQRLPSPPSGWTPAYWLDLVDAPEAWDVTKGSNQVFIGFADTGVNGIHPDLVGKMNEVGSAGYASDHGTHVAGIISAQTNNARGVAAIGYNANLIHANAGSTTGSLAAAIVALADANARIINISVGTPMASDALRNAINYAYSVKQVLVVAAAGNCGNVQTSPGDFVSVNSTICYDPDSYNPDTGMALPKRNVPIYPAAFANVLAVGSIGPSGIVSSFSNRNEPTGGVTYVDVSAPGESIVSTLADGGYGAMSGTSMAAPIVAGIAGLIVAAKSEITVDELFLTIENSAVSDGLSTYGTVNAQRALQLVMGEPLSTPTRGAEPEALMPEGYSSLNSRTSTLASSASTCADGVCSVAAWPCKGPDIQRDDAKCQHVWREVYAYPPPPIVVTPGCGYHDCYILCASVDCGGTLSIDIQWNMTNNPYTVPGCFCGDFSHLQFSYNGASLPLQIGGCARTVGINVPNLHCEWSGGFAPGGAACREYADYTSYGQQHDDACRMQRDWHTCAGATSTCGT